MSADVRCSTATASIGPRTRGRAIGNLAAATVRQITTIALRLAQECRFASQWLTAGSPAFPGLRHATRLTRRASKATIEGAAATVTDLKRDYAGISAKEFTAWFPYANPSDGSIVQDALIHSGWR